ncbi:TlpA family protein disulfide reductase [Corynebacterium guangdongense]|uniref:Thiol-disulfide isomerase/thioredoxin n=1 Tax=Corynebacterium guangdongense TaxID=1783348 RepID=A0ABU2A0U9_9CORY|nr:TlpA disulfide reductase family protein [Corynebacterium guangdongense]MDR7330811.1 thiol-disulfide isomerase/thioredoxin [Corynebacterium guangdongense]WJZ16826.1 Thioredoxin [Corynebacterium guangdongense]
MKNQLIWISVGAVLMTVAVIAGAMFLLRDAAPVPTDTQASASQAADPAPAADVPARADCPSTGVGGVDLPCLGGGNGDASQGEGVTVVNVWAWWCGPCRDELPHFEEYAAQNPKVTVVGVHADSNPANGAALLNELDLDFVSYQDSENKFAGTLGLPGVIPITVVFRGAEQIAMYPTPFDSTEELAAAVTDALAGGA